MLACIGLWLCLCAAGACASADAAPSGCIEVEVNGERVPDYACISRLLAPASSPSPPAPPLGSEQRIRQPPSALGLANRAATQQRMGSSFGVSTQPQRPPPPPPPPVIRP